MAAVVLAALVLVALGGGAVAQTPTCGGRAATIVGTDRSERLVGTDGDDVIVGLGGDDLILGRGGNDVICAGSGHDRVLAGSGNDRIFGQRGDDFVYGQGERDVMVGGAGDDHLYGEDDDVARGGPGRDRCAAFDSTGCNDPRLDPEETALAFVDDAVAGRSIVSYFSGLRLVRFDIETHEGTFRPYDPRPDARRASAFFGQFRGSAYSVEFPSSDSCAEFNGGDTGFSCSFIFTSQGDSHEIRLGMTFGSEIQGYDEPLASPVVELRRGDAAPAGFWYDVRLSNFEPGSTVTVYCNDSLDERFWTQQFRINRWGQAADSTLCFSGDGPDHWVTTDTGVRSNTVEW